MNERVKKLWVEALRSGKYTHIKNTLRRGDCFCAVGVLCDLYAIENNISWGDKTNTEQKEILGFYGTPPDIIEQWAGLCSEKINFNISNNYDSVIRMNDKFGRTFENIADYIETNL